MITLGHSLVLIFCFFLLLLFTVLGNELVGGVGLLGGLCLGLLLDSFVLKLFFRHRGNSMISDAKKMFKDKSSEELRELIHKRKTLIPNLVLLALMLRKENIDREIYPVLDMLESENSQLRILGYAAFQTAYPYLAVKLNNYSPVDSLGSCHTKVSCLRDYVNEQLKGTEKGI